MIKCKHIDENHPVAAHFNEPSHSTFYRPFQSGVDCSEKRGHWVQDLCKKGAIIQAYDIGRHIGKPHPMRRKKKKKKKTYELTDEDGKYR